ncbi:MAG: aspartate aminotransferase family protein [Armatimonadetes bacterium]|nr:aspartate aminotransferase family protein [Armatimonadota bacterium]
MDADALFADVVDKYSDHINPYLGRLMAFAGFGVEMRSEGCYIWDHEGRQFLDCLGGYGTFALGHRHPKIIEAVKNQLDSFGLSGKAFFNKQAADLADKLAEIAPPGLEYSFFCNSGTEAVEAALKFAKGATKRSKIISTDGSYHGKTLGALATIGRDKYRTAFEPLMPGVSLVPFGDAEAGVAAIDGDTAAFIVEPVQGEGGINLPPDGYLKALREACTRHGAMLIVDEVQTGMARTGPWFASEHDGISGDLMPLAKAIGGGIMPLGVMMGTKDAFDALYEKNPLAHTSTFGGNSVACAAGLATLQVIEEEGLRQRSVTMGNRLLKGLQEASKNFPDLITEARGRGLMIGVEFAMDEVGELVVAQQLKRGLVAAYTLGNPRIMRFEPPLVIDENQVDFAVDMFYESVQETSEILAALV